MLTGVYTTAANLALASREPHTCVFRVNKLFSVAAPALSFFLPAAFMMYAYVRSDHQQQHARDVLIQYSGHRSSCIQAKIWSCHV